MENASLGLTLCAERGAFQAAVSAGAVSFTAVAVVGSGPRPAYPCGACRQVMAEFCTPAFRVYLASARNLGTIRTVRLGTLLPHAFSLEHRRTSDP
jgi:cytidine deaminase